MVAGFLPYVAAMALTAAAIVAFTGPGMRPRASLRVAELAALAAIALSLGALGSLLLNGPIQTPTLGLFGLGLSATIDPVSTAMFLLVTFIGWVVVRYSATYLDGEARQGAFMGWLGLTLAAVVLLVTAGNLAQLVVAWVLVGVGLDRLLLFYAERQQSVVAARKARLFARASDLALVGAAIVLVLGFGTGDISTLNDVASGGAAWGAAGLLALAAVLKSAQFPLHGWLTQVMEAPTPVSALLHAGVVNGGGFLLIRFADVMLTAPGILALLVAIGGLTAIIGGLAMLTQSAVKTALAWSTVSQMGFMVLQCGLGLFPLALLHIVAHSLYKAHAFLSSGTAVEAVRASRRAGPVAVPSGRAVLKSFAIALGIFFAMGMAFGLDDKAPQAVALGAILIFGVAYLIAQGLAEAAPMQLTLRTAAASAAFAFGYFALQAIATWATHGTLPAPPEVGPLEWALIVLAVASFGAVAVAQALFPLWAPHPAVHGLRVHLSNGLYADAIIDRLIGRWTAPARPAL